MPLSKLEGSSLIEKRILVLAPTSNDGALTAEFITKAGLTPMLCAGMQEILEDLEIGCAAALIAEEALTFEDVQLLAAKLEVQPSWSDLPILVITGNGDPETRKQFLEILTSAANVYILERPFRPATLISTLEFALRARRRQYQVRSLLEERDQMTSKLRDADRRKDEFLAMLAHELRNPLASLSTAAMVLEGSSEPESHEWAAKVLQRQLRHLTHLIDDLLDVSRITTGKIRLQKEIIDVAALLDRACESVLPLVKERGHELVCNYKHGTLWAEADATRVEQIILNLLTNAAKYTPQGGVIRLSGQVDAGELELRVQDNGLGIAPERLPDMFRLFAQGERSIARSEGGLGIGLTIVERLTEMHGGRVEAHSDGPNCGSTFIVRIPAWMGAIPHPAKQLSREVPERGPSLRVLIVDDNVDTAKGLARLLERAGYKTELAHDGSEALMRLTEFFAEVIVMDIGLPGMDGFEVLKHVRKNPNCANSLVLAVTGYGQEEDRLRALGAGFDHHLVKPVNMDELKSILAQHARRDE